MRWGLCRSGRSGIVWAALLALMYLAAPGLAGAFQDEFVPTGHVALELSRFQEQQEQAYDRSGRLRPLRSYLLPDRTIYGSSSGKVERTLARTDLRLTYGFSDTTNLFAELPYVELEQDSHLRTDRTQDEFVREIEAQDSQSLSGLGDLRLLLMFRPLFSDRNGFAWGYGVQHPLRDRSESDPGLYAPALRSPAPSLRGFMHYTRYPRLERSRFDMRLELETGLNGEVETFEGKKPYRSGTGVIVELGWFQEAGPAGFGFALEERYLGQSRVNGIPEGDPVKETLLRGRLGFGNLRELEEGPVSVPYQLMLTFDRSLRGFNAVYSDGVSLSLMLFF
jgi:hypothetical protein